MLTPGQEFVGCQIEGEIGRGGMGVVYRAYDHDHSRMVAIKLIDSELSLDSAFRERFERERRAQASLDAHPYIVDIHSSGESDEGLYLVMKFIDGPNLGQMMLEHGPPTPRQALALLEPIADALDFAHQAGPIHRDLKPQNILLDSRQRSFLTDFGLAWVPGQSRMTTTGAFMGTTAYASPEQLKGEPTTGASDIYSFSCVLFECLTGQVPFSGKTHFATALAHASNDRPAPSDVDPSLPRQIDDVISRGMAKDPLQRYDSATLLLHAANEALGDPHPESPRSARKATVTGGRSRRGAEKPTTHPPVTQGAVAPRWIVGIGLVALALAGFLIARAGSKDQVTDLTSNAAGGHLELRYPESWDTQGASMRIPGLQLSTPIDLRERGGGSRLTAGISSAGGKLLLPDQFLKTLRTMPGQNAVVDLGQHDAYYYPGLRPAGSPPLNLYVMPTTAGVATVACKAAGDPGGAAQCGGIAGSLHLRQTRAYPLGPSSHYARILNRELNRLQRRRAAGLRKLSAAETTAAQAKAATEVRDSLAAAAASLAATRVSPQSEPANARVVASLRRAASAYDQLATTAKAESTGAYNAARRRIHRAEVRVKLAINHLGSLGYVVGR